MLFIKIHLVLKCEFENSPLIIGHQYIIQNNFHYHFVITYKFLIIIKDQSGLSSRRETKINSNLNSLPLTKIFQISKKIINNLVRFLQCGISFFFFFFKEVQDFSYPFNEHASNKDAYLTDHTGNSTPITGFPSPYYFGFSKTAKSLLHTQHTDAHIHVQNALYIPKLFMVLITVYLLKIKTILNHKHKNWVVRFSISHECVYKTRLTNQIYPSTIIFPIALSVSLSNYCSQLI